MNVMPCGTLYDSDSASSAERILSSGDEDNSEAIAWREDVLPPHFDLREEVTRVIVNDMCERKCLSGKAALLENFFLSITQMTGDQRKCSALTALAVLMKSEAASGKRQRGKGVRKRFKFDLLLLLLCQRSASRLLAFCHMKDTCCLTLVE